MAASRVRCESLVSIVTGGRAPDTMGAQLLVLEFKERAGDTQRAIQGMAAAIRGSAASTAASPAST